MEDYGDLWFEYSVEFNSKLIALGEDWDKLDTDEQEIAALWKMFVDINDGGFIEFFCNWGYQCFSYAMRGLKRIGEESLYNLLSDAYYDVIDKFKDDDRITEYWDILSYITEKDEQLLEDVDTQFWETECDGFTKSAYEYYSQTLKKTTTGM